MAVGIKNPNPTPPILRAASWELVRAVAMSCSERTWGWSMVRIQASFWSMVSIEASHWSIFKLTSSMSPNTAANRGEAIPNPMEAIMPTMMKGSSGL